MRDKKVKFSGSRSKMDKKQSQSKYIHADSVYTTKTERQYKVRIHDILGLNSCSTNTVWFEYQIFSGFPQLFAIALCTSHIES